MQVESFKGGKRKSGGHRSGNRGGNRGKYTGNHGNKYTGSSGRRHHRRSNSYHYYYDTPYYSGSHYDFPYFFDVPTYYYQNTPYYYTSPRYLYDGEGVPIEAQFISLEDSQYTDKNNSAIEFMRDNYKFITLSMMLLILIAVIGFYF